MSQAGMKHVRENYNFEDFENSWIKKIDDVSQKYGSWNTRKQYNRWTLKEVA